MAQTCTFPFRRCSLWSECTTALSPHFCGLVRVGNAIIQWTFKQELEHHAGCGQPVSSGTANGLSCQRQAATALTSSSTLSLGPWRTVHAVLSCQQESFCTLFRPSWKSRDRTALAHGLPRHHISLCENNGVPHLSQEAVLGDSGVLWALLLWGQLLILGNYAP